MSSEIKANAEFAEQMKNSDAQPAAPLADEVMATVGGGSFLGDAETGLGYLTNPIGSAGDSIYHAAGGNNSIVGSIISGAGGMFGHL